MSEIAVKHRKMYVDHPKDISRLICLIHGPGNSSDECKVLGEFCCRYSKSRPTKDYGHDPVTIKNQYTARENDIVQHAVDGITLQQNNKLSAEDEAHGNIDSEIDEKDIYWNDNMSLDEKKENTE